METPGRAHAQEFSFGPHSEPQPTPTSPGDPTVPAGRSGPGSYGVTALPQVPVHVKPCVRPPRGPSVSLSPEELLHSSPAGLESQVLWGLHLLMPDPQAGEPDVGLQTLTHMGEPL